MDEYAKPTDESAFEAPESQLETEPCESCGRQPAQTQNYMYVMSFLLFTSRSNYPAHLCRSCATRTAVREQLKSAVLGWWGIPWGLLTFQALWINTRALLRWSTLSAGTVFLGILLSLTPIVGLGYLGVEASREQEQAEATGDWVADDVIELVERADERFAEYDLEGALLLYLEAYEKEPRSSVINRAIANLHHRMGRSELALPYSEVAVERNPASAFNTAQYGLILYELGYENKARATADRLVGLTLEDSDDADWAATLYAVLEDWEQAIVTAEAGIALDPTATYLEEYIAGSLVELDRFEDLGTLLNLAAGPPQDEAMSFYADVYEIHRDAGAFLPTMFEHWEEDYYSEDGMQMLVDVVERSGYLDSVRERVREWLFADSTSGDVWMIAAPWFEGQNWNSTLDDYLSRRMETVPALLRIAEMNRLTDLQAILGLASRARMVEHQLNENMDGIYFSALLRQSKSQTLVEMEQHAVEREDHLSCRYYLASLLLVSDPGRARSQALELKRAGADDPALAVAADVVGWEADVIEGHAEEAFAKLDGVTPGSSEPYLDSPSVALITAEAAFHTGRQLSFERTLGSFLEYPSEGDDAAGLLLRWMAQLSLGDALSYRADVAAWLERHGDAVRNSESTSAIGILLAEGVIDREHARTVAARYKWATLELVAFLKAADESGRVAADIDLSGLQSIARSSPSGEYASRLARSVLEQRGVAVD